MTWQSSLPVVETIPNDRLLLQTESDAAPGEYTGSLNQVQEFKVPPMGD